MQSMLSRESTALQRQLTVVCTPRSRRGSQQGSAVLCMGIHICGGLRAHHRVSLHAPTELTHSHGQVCVLCLAGGAYYSLLVFLSV